MIDQFIRRWRKFLGGDLKSQEVPRFAKHRTIYNSAVWIVRFYYIINLYFVYSQLASIREQGLAGASLDAVWVLFWVKWVGLELSSLIILHVSIAAGLVGVIYWEHRGARIFVVFSQLLVAALANSFGAVNHGFHEWFWIGVCFVFLPSGSVLEIGKNRADRFSFLVVFSLAQGLVLLFYSLSGLYKVSMASIAVLEGRVGGFSPEAMAITLANRMVQTDSDAIWAPFIIENYWIGWPLYLGIFYIEFVSIVVFLRPELHRLWGMILIAFHFGTFLFMTIPFPSHVLINAMLFVFSPFAPDRLNWKTMLRQLPIFGLVLGRLSLRRPPDSAVISH